jgi:hypothetical protein
MGAPDINSNEISAASMQNLTDYLPKYLAAANSQVLPTEQAKLAAEQATAPGRAQLELDQYKQFAPQFSELGTQIGRQQQQGQAANDLATVQGTGGQLAESLTDAQRRADPEFYALRELALRQGQRLNDSIVDPNSGLSPTERIEIDRSLARDNNRRGTEAPTATSTVSNAMAFGNAGEARRSARQQQLAGIFGATADSAPATKSGIDVGSAILNRPIINNGENRFTNPQTAGQESYSAAGNLFNQFQNTGLSAAQGNQSKKTALDQAIAGVSAAGSLLGGV